MVMISRDDKNKPVVPEWFKLMGIFIPLIVMAAIIIIAYYKGVIP